MVNEIASSTFVVAPSSDIARTEAVAGKRLARLGFNAMAAFATVALYLGVSYGLYETVQQGLSSSMPVAGQIALNR